MERCSKGTIGNPIFKNNDIVGFYITPYREENEVFCVGNIYIVDSYGTFEQDEEPSYDVMIENYNGSGSPCLIKHIRESECYKL